ncbi:hypothetical protein [Niabella drilacis]|uniref:Uncharacterized protein n=1 Tax=Niabella drilacis (strain DSM 25811 / CCM 8410 / CCUG 62505 / LMG 26954 / E90) TaxID=1285928 RepID=A0A1G7BYP4_NIADE|nr:hypothetical protein [Niabella drilacis]SDE31526.1 hypothetical protein SAMN04487894_13424 [Niabella drilacis]
MKQILEPQQVLVWTCVLVFVATATITILALVGKIKIEPFFLKRLFITLLLEVVVISVLAFKNSFKPASKVEFIKIVSPINNFDASNNQVISVYGAYNINSNETVRGEIKANNETIPLTNMSGNNNVFYTQIDSAIFKKSRSPTICFSIYDDSNKVVSDCIILKAK